MLSLVLPPSRKVSAIAMRIGDRIRLHRRRLGMTQKELAARVGVSPGTIGMYETNRREPDLETIRRLAEVLGVTVAELVGETATDMPREGRDELAFHHVDRLLDPDAPIRPSLKERILRLRDELGRLADELEELEKQ